VAPYDAAGLDWLAGMAAENVAEFGAAVAGEAALTPFLDQAADQLRAVTGEQVAAALGGLVSEVDTAALTDEFADFVAAGFRAALRSGIAGWRDDDLAFVRPWGFGLEVRRRWPYGKAARTAWSPVTTAVGCAATCPGHAPTSSPHEGHLSLPLGAFGTILDDLLELSGIAP